VSVIVGSPGEKERIGELVGVCSGKTYNLAGRTTLAELAGVLRLSRLHIAALHIAAAVGAPTVISYGPSNWRDWAPQGPGHRVVVPDMPCVPFCMKGCEGRWVSRCLDALAAEKVQEVIREALSA
jgi:ADP-heptose:LPS heptosyltransferase